MANMSIHGIVFDTQSLSMHDGPGIRTLVFLKGCPMACLWCANPEGQSVHPEKRYHEMNCRACLCCMTVCPRGAVHLRENPGPKQGFITFQREKCLQCDEMPCVDACPNRALQLLGKPMTVADVMKIIRRDLPYYRGIGGITLSGGEPLLQTEFAVEVLKACQEEYVNTAAETAMHLPWQRVEAAMPYTDLFLCDIKHMDSDRHKEITRVPNTQILSNIARLSRAKPGCVLIRVPLIPGFNDTPENLRATAAFAREVGINRINILPYHRLGEVKYTQLGMKYEMPDVAPPSKEQLAGSKQAIEEQGVKCIIG